MQLNESWKQKKETAKKDGRGFVAAEWVGKNRNILYLKHVGLFGKEETRNLLHLKLEVLDLALVNGVKKVPIIMDIDDISIEMNPECQLTTNDIVRQYSTLFPDEVDRYLSHATIWREWIIGNPKLEYKHIAYAIAWDVWNKRRSGEIRLLENVSKEEAIDIVEEELTLETKKL